MFWRRQRKNGAVVLAAFIAFLSFSAAARAQSDWTTFGFSPQHTGYNPNETSLTKQNVGSLAPIWAKNLGGPILTQPTFVSNLQTNRGLFDVVFVATMYGDVYAVYASTGATLWHRSVAAVQTNCDDFAGSGGLVGVIGTLTIDRTNNRVFLVSGDGNLHALDLTTGAELAGWPVQVVDPANAGQLYDYGSPTYDPATTFVYVPLASACDVPPYHGQVVQVNASQHAVSARWYSTGQYGPDGGGIWGPGGVSLSTDGSAIYALTGNTLVLPDNQPYAESLVKLNQGLQPVAYQEPVIDGFDLDFGATPLLFQPPGCPLEIAAVNKSGTLFIYDASTNTSIDTGPLQSIQITGTDYTDNGNFIGVPAYDPGRQRMFFGSPSDSADGTYTHGLIAMDVGASCTASLAWQAPVGLDNIPDDNPTIPPTVANGVVYYADGDASQLFAFDADTGAQLWNSGSLVSGGIFASPAVVNGRVYLSGYGTSTLYALAPGGTRVPNSPLPN